MIDIQSSEALIAIDINKVGVKDIAHPVTVTYNGYKKQPTHANFDMYVSLPKEERGTHMSRFLEILNTKQWDISAPALVELLKITQERLKAKNAYINVGFKLFLEKLAPVSNIKSLMDYDIKFEGALEDKDYSIKTTIKVPVTTLCPCSKELAKYNAHNQRSYVTLKLDYKDILNLKDIITLIESKGSCEVWGVLKREDEKYVTERAYENPKFVEDIARELADSLNNDKKVNSYIIEVENLESIHNHAAYARIESA